MASGGLNYYDHLVDYGDYYYYSDEDEFCGNCGNYVCLCGSPPRHAPQRGRGPRGGGGGGGSRLRSRSRRGGQQARAQRPQLQPPQQLPDVCADHQAGMCAGGCGKLHLCRLFLADICKFDVACYNGHSLTTDHNVAVCLAYGLDSSRMELELVRRLSERFQDDPSVGVAFYHRQLEWCARHGAGVHCEELVCNRVHICRFLIENRCRYGEFDCRYGHCLHSEHNRQVLIRHRADQLADAEVLDLLQDNLDKTPMRRPAYFTRPGPAWNAPPPAPAPFQPAAPAPPPPQQRRPPIWQNQMDSAVEAFAERLIDYAQQRNRGPAAANQPQPGYARTQNAPPAGSGRDQSQQRGGPSQPASAPGGQRGAAAAAGARRAASPVRVFSGLVLCGPALAPPSPASADGGRVSPPPELAEELQCAVCLGTLRRASTLGCGHSFCAACVEDVRRVDPKCPVCREHIAVCTRSVVLDNIITNLTSKEKKTAAAGSAASK